jgi:hypothetical protein
MWLIENVEVSIENRGKHQKIVGLLLLLLFSAISIETQPTVFLPATLSAQVVLRHKSQNNKYQNTLQTFKASILQGKTSKQSILSTDLNRFEQI